MQWQAVTYVAQNRRANTISGIPYAICKIVSLDQLIAKLQKLSKQVEKGMSKQSYSVWTGMIREDLYKISNAEVRKGALKLLGVVECAGFCLDRAPEARESLILPNLKPLIDYLIESGRKKLVNAAETSATPVVPLPPVVQALPPEALDAMINPS